MALLKQSTAYTRAFLLVQSADHITGLTGATPTVTISKAGAAFGAAAGTVTEIANGFYKVAFTTADTNTLGDLAVHVTATSADPTDFVDQVSAALPDDVYSRLGAPVGASISADVAAVQADTDNLQTRVPTALVGGRMDSSVSAIISGTITAATIATDAITAAKIAADAIGASELAADAVTEIQAAVAAGAVASVTGAVGSVTGNVGGNVVGSVGSVATGGITAGSIAADAIGASELAADAVTEIQSGLATAASLVTAQADLDDLQARLPAALVSGRMDSSVGAMASGVVTATAIAADAIGAAELAADAVAEIQSGLATAAALSTVQTGITTIQGVVDTEVAAILAAVDTEVAAIKAKTDNLPASPAAAGSSMGLTAGAVDDILEEQIGDSTITVRQALRVLLAGMAGKLSGAATTTVAIRNVADSADVIVASVDASGNRSSVVVTP